jgi:muramoyltetrapeptide carboxypeptidase
VCKRGIWNGRIIDKLNFARFAQKPKWIIGFSDLNGYSILTSIRILEIVLFTQKCATASPMIGGKAELIQVETINSIRQALSGDEMKYMLDAHPSNILGTSERCFGGRKLKNIRKHFRDTKSDIIPQVKYFLLRTLENTVQYRSNVLEP